MNQYIKNIILRIKGIKLKDLLAKEHLISELVALHIRL